jgi:hypothetical protein
MVERFHRQLKSSLQARLCSASWLIHLPWVLLGLRSAPKEDCGLSSAEMFYGTALTLPGQFLAAPKSPQQQFVPQLQAAFLNFQRQATRPSPQRPAVPRELLAAKFVYVR